MSSLGTTPRAIHPPRAPSTVESGDDSSPEALLRAITVGKRYGSVVALEGIDLEVLRGETVVLIGESGCGKSTLLKLFNRMLLPDVGEIHLFGRPSAGLDPIPLRRRIGYVQQGGGLLPHWTAARNVELVPELLGWKKPLRIERSQELLGIVGLDPTRFAQRYPAELSGGQRQRVAFARALAGDPEVVLLDEPFGAVDAMTRASLQEQFLELKEQLGKTMVLVTHDLDEALRLGTRIVVLKEGAILRGASPAELLSEPGHEYIAALLDHARRSHLWGSSIAATPEPTRGQAS